MYCMMPFIVLAPSQNIKSCYESSECRAIPNTNLIQPAYSVQAFLCYVMQVLTGVFLIHIHKSETTELGLVSLYTNLRDHWLTRGGDDAC